MRNRISGREMSSNRTSIRAQDGQTLAEYTLILSFIALACVAAVTLMGNTVSGFFYDFGGSF